MKKILIPMLALALTGCSAVVDDKYYVPAFERNQKECFYMARSGCMDGKDVQMKVPECWRLVIEEGIDVDSICVPKDTWEKTQVGQEWTDETYPL